MNNKLWILLSIIFTVFYSCDDDDIVHKEDLTKKLINTAKFDYQTKFKHLKHFNDYLSTPLWDNYETKEDSINRYVYIPFKRVVGFQDVNSYLTIVSNKDEKYISYYIKIKNESIQLRNRSTENQVYNLYVASRNNKIISEGYIENNQFIMTNDILVSSLNDPLKLRSDFYDSACKCHNGGTLPEIIITPPGGSGGGGNDWWNIPNPGLVDPPPSGGGVIKPSYPSTEPKDPCANMSNKMSFPQFKDMLGGLKGLTGKNYEAGQSWTYSDGKYTFTPHNGSSNSGSIEWAPSTSSPINGFAHTHYDGILPTFSASDLIIPYYWDSKGGIKDLSSFTLGLVTSNGTYFLTITDVAKYKNFGEKYLNSLDMLEFIYGGVYGITPNTNATIATNSLATLLNKLDSGLGLMSKSGSGDKFEEKKVDSNNNVSSVDCK